jgi:hypothetical protein
MTKRYSNRDEQDQELDDIDKEILHLGQEGDEAPSQTKANECIPRILAHSTDVNDSQDLNGRSPKRGRTSPDRDSPDLFDRQTNIEEAEEEDFEQPSPKKLRRTSRRNSTAEARGELLLDLKSRKISKGSQRASANVNGKSKKPAKSEKKIRSLPVDELVIVSERFDNSDAEVSDEGKCSLFLTSVFYWSH